MKMILSGLIRTAVVVMVAFAWSNLAAGSDINEAATRHHARSQGGGGAAPPARWSRMTVQNQSSPGDFLCIPIRAFRNEDVGRVREAPKPGVRMS
jgi:hypothetical protein